MKGKRFGRLLVVRRAGKNADGKKLWRCLCLCGARHSVQESSLRYGYTRSCGCLRREVTRSRMRRNNPTKSGTKSTAYRHGAAVGRRTLPEYNSYRGAKGRCTNPRNRKYPRYGGRGIRFLFTSFRQFLSEVGNRPSPKHSLDRRDNDGNYAPGNVRWATAKQQANNQSRSKRRT